MAKTRIAIVTGSSKGIGRGIAYRLATEGCDIVVNYHSDEPGAEETARVVAQRGRQALVVQGNIGLKKDVDRVFDQTLERFGVPHIIVNNAAIQTWQPLLELEESDWDRTLRTNLKGTFLCTQRAARELVAARQPGRIINIGSGSNRTPFPNLIDYTCSKGGIEMLTKVAAVELGAFGITVNCVAPGAIEIERTRAEVEDYAGTWGPITPARRIGQVEDVAAAVAFLVSDEAEFITGQTLFVDGGLFSQGPWPYQEDAGS